MNTNDESGERLPQWLQMQIEFHQMMLIQLTTVYQHETERLQLLEENAELRATVDAFTEAKRAALESNKEKDAPESEAPADLPKPESPRPQRVSVDPSKVWGKWK